jgi:hypothetical protein
MAFTLEKLKKLCDGEGLKYFLAPDRPAAMMVFGGTNGRYQVIAKVEMDGRFVQVRTIAYLHCPADHPNLVPVLKVLGHLNYQLRLVKFGWDPSDGEIAVYCDIWVEDGDLTQTQFKALFRSLVPAIDLNHQRLTRTIETGIDPGEVAAGTAGGLPKDIEEALRKIAVGTGPATGPGPQEGPTPEKGKDKPGSGGEPWTQV